MATERMVHVAVSVDEEKWKKFKQVAERRRVPAALLVREGIERVLDLAEKQQATVERYQKEQGL